MNCANHADASAVAYCRTCGKALCANCTRPVRGVIYCEDCLGAKMETPAPPTAYQQVVDQGLGMKVPPAAGPGQGPNPTVAGILAGFFPFGVGAVYTGQYAKGLAHLIVFGLLFAAADAAGNHDNDGIQAVCILGLVFFVIYQIIDSVRSAKAIQMAQPVPDPFGLAATFGGGAKIETSKVPMGAIVLIGVGVLFLLHTMGLGLGFDRFWPLILIFIGGWMFVRNWGSLGSHAPDCDCSRCRTRRMIGPGLAGCTMCQCARCHVRRIMGPVILVTIGVLFLLESLHVGDLGFHRTWPVILLVIGALKLLQGNASVEGHTPFAGFGAKPSVGGGPNPPAPSVPPTPPVPPTGEVNRG